MRIPENDIRAIREQADIADVIARYLPLEKKGKDYVAVCPFHDDHDPSMRVSTDKQIYKCFVCGAGGNVFTFIQNYEKVPFVSAVQKVADLIHYPLHLQQQPAVADPRKDLWKTLDLFTSYCRYELSSKDGEAARQYLERRKFSKEILDRFEIGYAPDRNMVKDYLQARIPSVRDLEQTGLIRIGTDTMRPYFFERIVIPIHDAQGHPVGYTARMLPGSGQSAKYINTTETPLYQKGKLIFNYHRAADAARKSGRLILCEGAMDVIGLAKAGIYEGIACLGTAITPDQLQLIGRLRVPVTVFYDQDAAGQKAAWNFGQKALKAGIPFSIVAQSSAKDPDDIFIEQGAEGVTNALASTVSFAQFAIEYLQREYNLKNYEDKKAYAALMESIIRQSLDSFEQPAMLERLAQITGFRFGSSQTNRKKAPAKKKETAPAVQAEILPADHGRIQAEKAILWAMLVQEEYIPRFLSDLGFLSDETCRKLGVYIQNCYQTDREVDPVALLSEIEEDDVRALLVELSEWPDFTDAADSLYSDSVCKIQRDLLGAEIEKITEQIRTSSDLTEKVNLMKRKQALVAQRQSLLARKNCSR